MKDMSKYGKDDAKRRVKIEVKDEQDTNRNWNKEIKREKKERYKPNNNDNKPNRRIDNRPNKQMTVKAENAFKGKDNIPNYNQREKEKKGEESGNESVEEPNFEPSGILKEETENDEKWS
eukprot:UN22680